jgi:hypothetical protein
MSVIMFANGLVADRDVGMGPTPQGSEEDKAKEERERPGAQGTAAPQQPPRVALPVLWARGRLSVLWPTRGPRGFTGSVAILIRLW